MREKSVRKVRIKKKGGETKERVVKRKRQKRIQGGVASRCAGELLLLLPSISPVNGL